MTMIIEGIEEAISYLKQGYILIVNENRIVLYYKGDAYYACRENWHSSMKESDLRSLFYMCSFQIYKPKKEEISLEKDEEYYAWRSKYL